jgi:hypothetical protein
MQHSGVECKRLAQRMKEVQVFLNTQKIDILLVSETHFTQQNYVNIPTYTTYATDHPDGTAHAGSATITRKDIKHNELIKYETDYIQATKISIEEWDGNLTISAIYCPHATQLKRNSPGHRFLVGGDFNVKRQYWGSPLINPKRSKNIPNHTRKATRNTTHGRTNLLVNRY